MVMLGISVALVRIGQDVKDKNPYKGGSKGWAAYNKGVNDYMSAFAHLLDEVKNTWEKDEEARNKKKQKK